MLDVMPSQPDKSKPFLKMEVNMGQPRQYNGYRDRTHAALLDVAQKVMESPNYGGAAGSPRLASETAEGHHC
ncbi:hypothetical protein CesoFtcFv8_000610 [Champsocephalus esox]|uniref:Uncharacterized protein n=1 Tax=Champsocephalus esox TaxID=159716 RepID=A0AAN8D1S6_9TELE|nr:hypothetical protein CesoFtcFv8_000610 [Champsocephalus esox]